MYSVVWTLFIVFIVYRLYYRKKDPNGNEKNTGRPPTISATPPRPRIEQKNTSQRIEKKDTSQRAYQKKEPFVKPQDAEESSTMAYLNEKARQDEAEHAREKREEMERLHKNYGGLRVAERHFDGDPISGGKRCVVCSYCGAENLVPMVPREQYSCYFCREALK